MPEPTGAADDDDDDEDDDIDDDYDIYGYRNDDHSDDVNRICITSAVTLDPSSSLNSAYFLIFYTLTS
jgi:hypothetical protein